MVTLQLHLVMNWLFDNFQIVALIGLAFASWLKHRFDAKMAEREGRNAPEEAEEDYDPQENWSPPYEPAQSYIPPLPQTPPPLPRGHSPHHSREDESAAVLKRQHDLQERLRKVKEAKSITTGGAAATRARLATSKAMVPPKVATTPSIRNSLRSPAELRRAIVMREILGPPVSLR